ncbi:hypothetical protein [Streptomyces sp. NPDC056387]
MLEEIPLTAEGLDTIELKPEEIACVLRNGIDAGAIGAGAIS